VTTYIGMRHGGHAIVSVVDDRTRCASMLDPGYRHVTKSPNGFDWGYTGAAPSQLAFAILLDHYGAPGPALLFYQDFKESVVALWNADRWELTTAEIESALAKIRILRSRASKELAWKQST
jgi:hypothetical protein